MTLEEGTEGRRVYVMGKVYNLGAEPTGDLYRGLLAYAAGSCPRGILVTRVSAGWSDKAESFLQRLSPFVQSRTQESEWPGTRLIGHTAAVIRFYFGPDVVPLLTEATDRLYGWLQPDLPEDLCLLKSDGTPHLVTIAHEKDGYFNLSQQEYSGLVSALPKLLLAP